MIHLLRATALCQCIPMRHGTTALVTTEQNYPTFRNESLLYSAMTLSKVSLRCAHRQPVSTLACAWRQGYSHLGEPLRQPSAVFSGAVRGDTPDRSSTVPTDTRRMPSQFLSTPLHGACLGDPTSLYGSRLGDLAAHSGPLLCDYTHLIHSAPNTPTALCMPLPNYSTTLFIASQCHMIILFRCVSSAVRQPSAVFSGAVRC
jgi:hypothetical protein